MSVEKMELLNLVGNLSQLDSILRGLVLSQKIEFISAMEEIDESNFTISMQEEHSEEIVDMCLIHPLSSKDDFKNVQNNLEKLIKTMDIEKEIDESHFDEDYKFYHVIERISEISNQFEHIYSEVETLREQEKILEEFRSIALIEKVDINFKEVFAMNNFEVRLGKLSNENRVKLSKNYENIPALIAHLGSLSGEEVLLVIFPKDLKTESERILRSVYFREIQPLSDILDTPKEIKKNIDDKLYDIRAQIEEYLREAAGYKALYGEDIRSCYSRIQMEKEITAVKSKVAVTKSFFYLSGWVPSKEKENIEKSIEAVTSEYVLGFKDVKEVKSKIKPPTQLSNGWLFKPFEMLVSMYGIPSYTESDPTVFLGLTYMILFGAMFGDLGQGLVIFIAGIVLAKKENLRLYGGILSRIGLSSMIFGFFYDSLFGYEHVISHTVTKVLGLSGAEALFIRPIENINTMLSASIGLGIILLFVSFGYSVYNKLKVGDIKEGVFGRNGIAGIILYSALLMLVLGSFTGKVILPSVLLGILVAIAVVGIVLREPLANLIKNERPLYHESVSEYYVESGFDLLETFLSLLSNSVSFIRVGAFALNHVGLFIAFHTMANIIGNTFGEILMFFIGNAMVIFLEGLIVMIQGLRLVYYELFSKYYIGEGNEFKPSRVEK